jgi:CheY-like chemotaxis protein
MAQVLALSADLLFGSRVQSALASAGHDVALLPSAEALDELLQSDRVAVLVVDLTDAALDGAAVLVSLRESGRLGGTRSLAFYAHVEADTRERAQSAGFDLVVPRSRMAREGAALVTRLAEEAQATGA